MDDGFHRHASDAAARRQEWRTRREALEQATAGPRWNSRLRRHLHGSFQFARRMLEPTRLYQALTARAARLGLTQITLSFPDLPPAFDGYSILHLTDLHLDHMPETAEAAAGLIAPLAPDLCVITGDIRDNIHAPIPPIVDRLSHIVSRVQARDGIFGILGNHDCAAMVAPMEDIGVTMLCNEVVFLERRGERIHLTGLDDVHHFHTKAAHVTLKTAPLGFGIALVHSPEVADHAAERHRLYLTGHTHGGQICLPGGRALITGLKRHRNLVSGLWEHGGMIGYTSRGVGASVIPLRLNCQGEVVLLTLRRGPQGAEEIVGPTARTTAPCAPA